MSASRPLTAEASLDDVDALVAADAGGMLRAVASGAAQVREAAGRAQEAGLHRLAEDGQPRAVIVCGMGGSAIAGDVLSAVAGMTCPVPVTTHRGHGLPAWVGAADLVIAVSCTGTTEETLSALQEAVRRGCRLLVVGAAGSPLEDLGARGRAVFVPVAQGRQPRASVWSLSVPLVLAGAALRLLPCSAQDVEEAAGVLEAVAVRCRPDADVDSNPAKALALELSGSLPVVWGTSPLGGPAAYRFACQLNENACLPAVCGVLPEVGHNQVVALDGEWASSGGGPDDFFRDRTDDGDRRLHVVLLREEREHPRVARRAEVAVELAAERGVPVDVLRAEGTGALARVASLIGLTDFTSTYLALHAGADPTPVDAIAEMKRRTASDR